MSCGEMNTLGDTSWSFEKRINHMTINTVCKITKTRKIAESKAQSVK